MATLSYPAPHTFWQHFEFESTITTALVVSFLTTLITYQIAALCTDLTLGCKPSKSARVHTFHTVLLSRRFSPLAVLNALLRHDALTRIYFRRHLAIDPADIPQTENGIPRDDARVKFAPAFFLVLLLLTPPVVSIFAIGVTIENERVFSFQEAGFKGLYLGVDTDEYGNVTDVLKRKRLTEDCEGFPVAPLPYDVVTARVMICAQTMRPGFSESAEKVASVGVTLSDGERITVQLLMGTLFWFRIYSGYLRTGSGESLVLIAAVEEELRRKLVTKAMEKILEVCGGGSTMEDSELYTTWDIDPADGDFVVGRGEVPCELDNEKQAEENMRVVLKVVDRIISVVKTERMLVKSPTGPVGARDSIDAGDKPFLRRRRRFMGIGVMAIAAIVVVLARVTAGLFANNDINDGIERIVKERLGLEYCESLLSEKVARTIVEFKIDDSTEERSNETSYNSRR